jgi:Na+/melibiose symporter-like transporter
MSDGAAKAELVSLRTKLFYGFGSVAFGIKDNGFQTILLLFYNQVIGLPAPLVGLAIAIALGVDAFLDPIVGQVSDNLRTRWGRRHPLMYASALPVAISYLLLWNPPHWSHQALFVYLLIVAIVVRTFITFYEIPSQALAPELTDDYDQRTSFVSFRIFFAWFGGLGMLIAAYTIFLTPDATHKIGQLNEGGYSRYGITASIIMFAAILISSWGTHRFIPHFRVPAARKVSMLQYAREMFSSMSNKAFLILIVAGILFNLSTGLVFALGIYMNTYFWELSSAQISIITLSTFLAVILAFAFAPGLSKRLGKKRAAMMLFFAGIVVGAIAPSLRLLDLFPANGSPVLVPLLFLFTTLSGGLAIGSSILLVSMLNEVVEDSELKTGRRSEGLFYAGSSFMQKAASGLGLLASGLVLSAVHFPAHAVPGHVDPQIIRNFAILYIPLTSLIYGVATAIIGFYPITRERHEENLRQLAAEIAQASEPVDMGVTR